MEKKTTPYKDTKAFFKEMDDHIAEHDDIKSRNHFMEMANRALLESRRNKGKFKRIVL